MLVIGERLNGTRKAIGRALRERNESLVRREASGQVEAGADFLDLNAGSGEKKEADGMRWMIETVQAAGYRNLCLDSSNPEVLAECLPLVEGEVMLNSINAEKEKLSAMLPLLQDYGGRIIALTMDDRGIPCDVETRLEIARELVKSLGERGIKKENIYLDPLVQPVSTNDRNGRVFLDSLAALKSELPGVRTVCGLSNVSFGLPRRRVLNRAFLVLAVGAGLDAALIDPTEPGMISSALAADGLVGNDSFCLEYLSAFRAGKLGE